MPEKQIHAVADPETKAPNPFDTSGAVLLNQPAAVMRIRSTVAARAPKKHEFFKVYDHPDYVRDGIGITYEIDGREEVCWAAPYLQRELLVAGAQPFGFRAYTVIVRPDVLLIWPQKLPDEDNRGASWHASALEVAEIAKKNWVKKVSNRSINEYEPVVAVADWGDPTWPSETFDELLKMAFKGDRLIDRPDHPILQKLRGEL